MFDSPDFDKNLTIEHLFIRTYVWENKHSPFDKNLTKWKTYNFPQEHLFDFRAFVHIAQLNCAIITNRTKMG